MTTAELQSRAVAGQRLCRAMFPQGSPVTGFISHTSRTGGRSVRIVATVNGQPEDVTGRVAMAIGERCDRHQGIKRTGAGYDPVADVVALLAVRLYGEPGALNARKL